MYLCINRNFQNLQQQNIGEAEHRTWHELSTSSTIPKFKAVENSTIHLLGKYSDAYI